MKLQWSMHRSASYLLGALIILTVLIVACADDAAPTPTVGPAATATPTPTPTSQPAKLELQRLKLASAPLSYDTNFTWLQGRSGQVDKRPAQEFLIGTDPSTSAYIPELAVAWESSPDAKNWTVTLRKGIPYHEDQWGTFRAADVRHAVFLLTQPEAIQSSSGKWRTQMGIDKETDTIESVEAIVEDKVEIVDDHKVIFHLEVAVPEFFDTISGTSDLVMESKARWDAGGKELYGTRVIGTGAFEFIERKPSEHVLYRRLESHWRKTPEYKELQFIWVPENSTRLAMLVNGEVHIAGVPRAVQREAEDRGMKVVSSTLPAFQLMWMFGGLYFGGDGKLDPEVPFVNKDVRRAMSMAINRQEITDKFLSGRTYPLRVVGYHPVLDENYWPGIYNPEWDSRFDEQYGYNPTKAKELLAQAGYADGFEFPMFIFKSGVLPSFPDISEAVAQYWQAIGLKPIIEEVEFSRIRQGYKAKEMHGISWGMTGGRIDTLFHLQVYNKTEKSVVHVYEHSFIDGNLEQMDTVVDSGERAILLREIGDHKFAEFAEIPMYWMRAEIMVNPKYIAEYVFPGTVTGIYSHLEFIKITPQ